MVVLITTTRGWHTPGMSERRTCTRSRYSERCAPYARAIELLGSPGVTFGCDRVRVSSGFHPTAIVSIGATFIESVLGASDLESPILDLVVPS
jgi:hypothetical protein